MSNNWLTRMTTSFAALSLMGGLAFLSGCDDCNECDRQEVTCCDGAEFHGGESRGGEIRNNRSEIQGGVRSEGSGQTGYNYEAEQGAMDPNLATGSEVGVENRDTTWINQRLIAIDRERVLYPDRVTALDAEAARLRTQLNVGINVSDDRNMRDRGWRHRDRDFKRDRKFDRNQTNINVNDRSGMRDRSDFRNDRMDRNRDMNNKDVNVNKDVNANKDVNVNKDVNLNKDADVNKDVNKDADINKSSDLKTSTDTSKSSTDLNNKSSDLNTSTNTTTTTTGSDLNKSNTDVKTNTEIDKPATPSTDINQPATPSTDIKPADSPDSNKLNENKYSSIPPPTTPSTSTSTDTPASTPSTDNSVKTDDKGSGY